MSTKTKKAVKVKDKRKGITLVYRHKLYTAIAVVPCVTDKARVQTRPQSKPASTYFSLQPYGHRQHWSAA